MKKMKKLSQFLKSHISGMLEAILLKCGMWSTDIGRHVHRKIVVFYKGSTELRMREKKLHFLSSCQYTHGVTCWLLGPHDTLLCVLI